jgi:hypothetical protein
LGPGEPVIVHATMVLASIAPDVRATSRPPCINRSVGMPLIARRDETEGAVNADRGIEVSANQLNLFD